MRGPAIFLLAALAGCSGRVQTCEYLANRDAGTVAELRPLGIPGRAVVSGADELMKDGILRMRVEKEALRVLFFERAVYRTRQTHYYLWTSSFFRIFFLIPSLFWLAPFDAIGIGHGGSSALLKAGCELDSEWVDVPGERVEHDVTLEDLEAPRTTLPAEGVTCVAAIREGAESWKRSLNLPKLRELTGTTDATGSWKVDLRPAARELAGRGTGWTLTFSLFPGNVTFPAMPVELSAEQVRQLADLP